MKNRYLQYEVLGDQFFGRAVPDLEPVTSEFSVSCFYVETMDEISAQLETYVQEVVAVGDMF